MNKKELLNLIKDKADEKEIPNLSAQIMQKLQNQSEPVMQELIMPEKRTTLKSYYIGFSTVLALVILFIGISLITTNDKDLFLDANFSDSVALSLIASSYQFDDHEINNQAESYTILLSGEEEVDLVENQIDGVLPYAYFMEIFLKHEEYYETKISKSDNDNYKKIITFTLYNFLDEQMIYELYYNQELNESKGTFEITALLINGANHIDLLISGEIDEKEYTLTYQQNDKNYTDIAYQFKNSNHSLSIKKYKNNNIDQELNIFYNDFKSATIKFIQGQTKGNYQFELKETQDIKHMQIMYEIGQTDSGTIDLELSNESLRNYILNVRPNHRPAFVVEKDRNRHSDHNHGKPNGKKK